MSAFPWCKWKGIPATANVYFMSPSFCVNFIYNFKCLLTFRCTNGHPWSRSVISAEEWGLSLAQCVSDFSTCYDTVQGRNDGKRMFLFVYRLENVRLRFMVFQATPSCIKTVFSQAGDFLGGLHFTSIFWLIEDSCSPLVGLETPPSVVPPTQHRVINDLLLGVEGSDSINLLGVNWDSMGTWIC